MLAFYMTTEDYGTWSGEEKGSLKMKRKKKVIHLKEKYGRKRRIPDQLEGITIPDREVSVTFSSEPKCYGGCSTDEN